MSCLMHSIYVLDVFIIFCYCCDEFYQQEKIEEKHHQKESLKFEEEIWPEDQCYMQRETGQRWNTVQMSWNINSKTVSCLCISDKV